MQKRQSSKRKAIRRQFDSLISVPVVSTIRANTSYKNTPNIVSYELIEEDILKGREAFIFTVQDDSMSGDHIYEGDRVLVVAQDQVSPSDIAVVAVSNGEATLKRVNCEGDMGMLLPSESKTSPILVPSKEVHIFGKVIEVRHRLE